ncbi:MAG: hypothetical protein PHC51_12890 [bacterium]|nr:hypothetical protein [bacterium]
MLRTILPLRKIMQSTATLIASLLILTSTALAEDLTTPAYTEYNTFLGGVNFLELSSTGSSNVNANVAVYNLEGALRGSISVTIPAGKQVDLDINSIVNTPDTYGLVKVTFNVSSTAKLRGRMATYSQNSNGSYSFAIAKELRNASRRRTYAISNSFDAEGRGYVAPNWLSITNLSSTNKTFTYRQYTPQGAIVRTSTVTLGSKQRRDIQAGHEDGEVVYLNEVEAPDSTTEYLSYITRYGTNSDPANFQNSPVYAIPLPTTTGTDGEQFTLISDREGDCWDQSNWLEVANTDTITRNVYLSFRRQDGSIASSTTMSIPAKNQFHFNATALLRLSGNRNKYGVARIFSDTGSKILMQSTVYTHSCNRSALQTAFTVPSLQPENFPISGSYNTFIDIHSRLFLLNTYRTTQSVTLALKHDGKEIYSNIFNFGAYQSQTLDLSDEATYSTAADTIGTLSAGPASIDNMIGFVVREHFANDATFDFAMPTPVQ